MAGTPIHTKRFGHSFNSKEIYAATADMQESRDEAEVTNSGDNEKQFLPGKASATGSAAGPADWADGEGVETLHAAMAAGTIAARAMRPNGAAAVSATNPSFTGNAFLTALSLSFDQGGAGQFSSSYRYNTGLPLRAEA